MADNHQSDSDRTALSQGEQDKSFDLRSDSRYLSWALLRGEAAETNHTGQFPVVNSSLGYWQGVEKSPHKQIPPKPRVSDHSACCGQQGLRLELAVSVVRGMVSL